MLVEQHFRFLINLTLNLRIPRLKWKLKKDENWSFEMLYCDREEFKENLFFNVSTNDLINNFVICLTLKNQDDLKTIKMNKTSISYLFSFDLHKFLNILNENSEELIISITIYEINEKKE